MLKREPQTLFANTAYDKFHVQTAIKSTKKMATNFLTKPNLSITEDLAYYNDIINTQTNARHIFIFYRSRVDELTDTSKFYPLSPRPFAAVSESCL